MPYDSGVPGASVPASLMLIHAGFFALMSWPMYAPSSLKLAPSRTVRSCSILLNVLMKHTSRPAAP